MVITPVSGLDGAALIVFQEAADRSGEARALANLGSVESRQDRYEQAIGWYQQALALFRDNADRTGEASALPDLGIAYQRQGRHAEAIDCYQQALALFGERRPDRRSRGA